MQSSPPVSQKKNGPNIMQMTGQKGHGSMGTGSDSLLPGTDALKQSARGGHYINGWPLVRRPCIYYQLALLLEVNLGYQCILLRWRETAAVAAWKMTAGLLLLLLLLFVSFEDATVQYFQPEPLTALLQVTRSAQRNICLCVHLSLSIATKWPATSCGWRCSD